MWFSIYDTNARALGLARLRHTFDALKRSAKIVFAPQNAPFPSTTPSDFTVSQADWSHVEDGECTSATRLSGAAIATLVGLGHTYTIPRTQLWLLSCLHGEPPALLTPPVVPSPHDFDFDIDLETVPGGEALNLSVPTLPIYSSITTSTSPTPSTNSFNGASRPSGITVCSPASESASLSMTSTPYASSSSADSDSSFEVASPPTDIVGIPDPQERSSDDGELGVADCPNKPSALSKDDTSYQLLEAEVLALMHRLAEDARHNAPPKVPSSTAAPEPENERPPSEIESLSDNGSADGTESEVDKTVLATGDCEDNESDDDECPTILYSPHSGNRYTLEGVIGRGGFSRVVRALDSEGRWCAVKMILKPKVYEWPDARQNLLREKTIMAKVADLGTGRLVDLYESWEDEVLIYFVMGHSPCSLHYLISPPSGVPKIELTQDDERLLCAEMIAALSVLHQNQIVHRDIKPDNFLVDPAGGVVLADFGLSIEADLYDGINGACGTEDYLAPEQRWCASYDSQIDVWQLACTFIELLTGLRDTWMGTFGKGNNPLSRDDLELEVLQQVLNCNVEGLLPANHPAKELVLEMIKIHPGERPTVEELKIYPWFDGINWDEVTYGPSVRRSFRPRHVPINPRCSPVYSTFFGTPSEPQRTPKVEENIESQMDMYELEPLAFVYPLLGPGDAT